MREKISDMTQDMNELKTELQRWKNHYAKAQDDLRNIDFKLNSIARKKEIISAEDQNDLISIGRGSDNEFVTESSLLDGQR